jgi:hypothetical protein
VLITLILGGCTASKQVAKPAASVAPRPSVGAVDQPSLAADLETPAGGRLIGGVPTIAAEIAVQDGEAFFPAPSSAKPKLTALQAFDAEERQIHPRARGQFQPAFRPGVHVRIGILNEQEGVRTQLAYALIYGPIGCINTSLNPPKDTGTCVSWTYLSVSDGRSLGGSQQQIPGS